MRAPNSGKITGPDEVEVKPAPAPAVGLTSFHNLEYPDLAPGRRAGKKPYGGVLGLAGKPMFRLEELAKKGDTVEVRARSGETKMARLSPK